MSRGLTVTHTYAELEISAAAYDEIAAKLRAADYGHAFTEDGLIDMHGIALSKPAASSVPAVGRPEPCGDASGSYGYDGKPFVWRDS